MHRLPLSLILMKPCLQMVVGPPPGMLACAWLGANVLLSALPVCGQDFMVGLSQERQESSDIRLIDSELDLRWRTTKREITVMAAVADLDVNYAPNPLDFLGVSRKLDETRTSEQITWREGLDQRWRWNFSAGGSDGFTDYRSLWLDEYYRQIFSTVRGYVPAKPDGKNVSIGGTYEYLPQSGMINWSLGYQVDGISPSYDKIIMGPLVRGRSRYQTWRLGLGSEHVLSPRLRFKEDFTALQTTARAWRYAYKAEALWAITDAWATHLDLEASREAEFHSVAASLALERDWSAKWFAGVQVRAYRDNGQVIDPSLISGAAPPIDSLQAQLTLRYSGSNVTWRVGIGPYLTRYAALTPGTIWFSSLYRDRNWCSVQAAWTLRI